MANVSYDDHQMILALKKRLEEVEKQLSLYTTIRADENANNINVNTDDIAATEGAIEELYEMMLGGEE